MNRRAEDMVEIRFEKGVVDWGWLEWYDPNTNSCLILLDDKRLTRVLVDARKVFVPRGVKVEKERIV